MGMGTRGMGEGGGSRSSSLSRSLARTEAQLASSAPFPLWGRRPPPLPYAAAVSAILPPLIFRTISIARSRIGIED